MILILTHLVVQVAKTLSKLDFHYTIVSFIDPGDLKDLLISLFVTNLCCIRTDLDLRLREEPRPDPEEDALVLGQV